MNLATHVRQSTAIGGFFQSPAGRILALKLLLFLVVCDGVSDPRERFRVDPSPVVGRWVERDSSRNPPREAVIERGEGFLTGHLEFERTGIPFRVLFTDASWDGQEMTFTTGDVFGAGVTSISWTARLVAGRDGQPTLLRFFPRVGGGVPFSVEYVRPN